VKSTNYEATHSAVMLMLLGRLNRKLYWWGIQHAWENNKNKIKGIFVEKPHWRKRKCR
jgi:hypothetical protein